MKDTTLETRLKLEDSRLQAVYDNAMTNLAKSERRASGEALGFVYIAVELGDDGGQWNRMGSYALKFLIVMLGVIPNLLMISVLL